MIKFLNVNIIERLAQKKPFCGSERLFSYVFFKLNRQLEIYRHGNSASYRLSTVVCRCFEF